MDSGKVVSTTRARARTRDALLQAARTLVAQKGFGGVSVGDIATQAGFTKGAFFSNFPSREAMLAELFGLVQAEQNAAMDALQDGAPKDLAHAIAHFAELAVRHAEDAVTPLLVAEIQLQARRDAAVLDEVQQGFDLRVAGFAAWLDALKSAYQLQTPMSSTTIARTILALAQGYAQQPADRSQIRGMVTEVLQRLLY